MESIEHTGAIAPLAGRRARQQQAHEANRRAILEEALQLFVADGYAQVSIRKIAAKSGYSPAAIYSYFPSKDEIFLALAEEGFRLLGTSHLVATPGAAAVDDLFAAVWRIYEFSKSQPHYFALVFLDRHVPRIGPVSERFAFMHEMRRQMMALVQRCIDEGVLPASVHPEVAVRLLWLPVLGFAGLRVSGRVPSHQSGDDLMRDAIDTTIAGLRAGAASRSHPFCPK